MAVATIVMLLAFSCVVLTKPLEKIEAVDTSNSAQAHNIQKRFVDPSLTIGDFGVSGFNGFNKMRTKRSEDDEECEKLRLCKIHANANRSFFRAFELYFVNRENARLWDHRARSASECDQRFSCYDR